MNVKLIAKTQGVGDLSGKSLGEILAYIARVSSPENQHNHLTSPKLLNYCIRNGHWSVFEACYLTFEITTSRAIAAQILRHRSATFQEFSQRYSEVSSYEEFEARRQDTKNRQNSISDMSEEDQAWFKQAQKDNWEYSQSLYREGLQRDIAKECVRALCPSQTTTTMYMTNNIRGWISYLNTRCSESTQREHRDIAEGIKHLFIQEIPEIKEACGW